MPEAGEPDKEDSAVAEAAVALPWHHAVSRRSISMHVAFISSTLAAEEASL